MTNVAEKRKKNILIYMVYINHFIKRCKFQQTYFLYGLTKIRKSENCSVHCVAEIKLSRWLNRGNVGVVETFSNSYTSSISQWKESKPAILKSHVNIYWSFSIRIIKQKRWKEFWLEIEHLCTFCISLWISSLIVILSTAPILLSWSDEKPPTT